MLPDFSLGRPSYSLPGSKPLTNFHLPRSSLLVLICAFAGRDLVLAACRHAVATGYRFYPYGDCMPILWTHHFELPD